jgi:hypothetical protein
MDTTAQDQNTAPSLSLGGPLPVPGASLAPPNNPLPVPVAGQKDKQNTASPLGVSAPSKVHMKFDDGTEGDVPQHRITDAIKDGGKITTRMFFDDGTEGWIPLNRVHDAIRDGGRLGYKPASTDAGQGLSQAETGTMAANAATGAMGISPNPLTAGFVKSAAETAHTLGAVAGKVLPNSLRNSLGLPASFQQPGYLESSNAGESAGKVGEGVVEFVMGDEALKGMSIAAKLGIAQKVAKMAEEYPTIAKALHIGMNATRAATASGAQSGLHDPSTGSVETGAAFGAGGEVTGELAGLGINKLLPRTQAAAETSAAQSLSQAASQRQGAARSVTDLAGRAVDNATGKGVSSASDFKTAADEIKQNFSPIYDLLREATGGVRNSSGRFGPNLFDDASAQIARAKKVLFSSNPASTDALKQAEKELATGEKKLQKIFNSGKGDPNDLAEAKQAWSRASTLSDLHDVIDSGFTEPASVRNLPKLPDSANAPSEVDPQKFVRRVNKAIDTIGPDKLSDAMGEDNFTKLRLVRSELNDLIGSQNYEKDLTKAARAYLQNNGVTRAAMSPVAAGSSLGVLAHVLGASTPASAGIGATAGLIRYMYTHPSEGIKILGLVQKSAPMAAQVAKQATLSVYNPVTGDIESTSAPNAGSALGNGQSSSTTSNVGGEVDTEHDRKKGGEVVSQ